MLSVEEKRGSKLLRYSSSSNVEALIANLGPGHTSDIFHQLEEIALGQLLPQGTVWPHHEIFLNHFSLYL